MYHKPESMNNERPNRCFAPRQFLYFGVVLWMVLEVCFTVYSMDGAIRPSSRMLFILARVVLFAFATLAATFLAAWTVATSILLWNISIPSRRRRYHSELFTWGWRYVVITLSGLTILFGPD
jgi:hypothetical protein